jgi:hypothetical protein
MILVTLCWKDQMSFVGGFLDLSVLWVFVGSWFVVNGGSGKGFGAVGVDFDQK